MKRDNILLSPKYKLHNEYQLPLWLKTMDWMTIIWDFIDKNQNIKSKRKDRFYVFKK